MAFDLRRMIANAVVLRVVYVLVALVLAWAGIGRAEAQDVSGCFTNETTSRWCANRGDAYESSKIAARYQLTVNQGRQQGEDRGWFGYQCNATYCSVYYEANSPQGHVAQAQRQWPVGADCPDGGIWNDSTHECEVPKECKVTDDPLGPSTFSVPPGTSENPMINAPAFSCVDGCKYDGTIDDRTQWIVDGQYYIQYSTMEPTGETCETGPTPDTAPTDSDGDGSSDGNDEAPNNPGQGGGGADGKPTQDESLSDSPNGDGSGDGNKSGGGGDCSSPPSSSGDAILAQIAYQTWATRCAIEGAKDGNGNLRTTESDGDAGGDPTGDGPQAPIDFEQGEPADDDGEEVEPVETVTLDIPSLLDTSGFLGGGSCPDFGSITMGPFGTHTLGGDWFCDWLPIFRALIILMATYTAIRILLGANL